VRISDEELNRIIELDHAFMADRRADWTERWNRVVASG
jgi:putative spermidine/putrescine transport system substrate-binding protein